MERGTSLSYMTKNNFSGSDSQWLTEDENEIKISRQT